jgi:hypothetical protein
LFFSCGGEEVGEGLFVFGFGGEFLFGVGQDALGRRGADAGAGVGLYGLDLGECLLLRLAHLIFLKRFPAAACGWRRSSSAVVLVITLYFCSRRMEGKSVAGIRCENGSQAYEVSRRGELWKSVIFLMRSLNNGSM